MARDATVLLASNRGPVAHAAGPDGRPIRRQSAGGVASALSTIAGRPGLLWVCAALSDADRRVAAAAANGRLDRTGEPGSIPVRMLDIDPTTLRTAYNEVANTTLWFVHHMLFDPVHAPVFDERFRARWRAYVDYNAAFADALADAAADSARVLIQDYHLSLVPRMLRRLRPDLAIAHFSHTPWAPPEYFRLLPDDIADTLCDGICGADHAGFLSDRWAEQFSACCAVRPGSRVDPATGSVERAGRTTAVAVHPLGVDATSLTAQADDPAVRARLTELREAIGDRQAIVRVDRAELSKNIVRGLRAYRSLLARYPELRGRVVHLVFAYPSRSDVPAYAEYAAAVRHAAAEIREEFGEPDWDPVLLATDDDLARSLAAYRLADVAVVNPIRDGMNLVAKEISITSDTGCALVLSREAGVADQLGDHALLVNPYDIEQTADAIHAGLTMPAAERRARAAALAAASAAHPPEQWLEDQLAALG